MRLVYFLLGMLAVVGVGAFDLRCGKISESHLSTFVKVRSCWVVNLNITQKGTKMTSARSIFGIDSIKGIWIFHQNINFMPRFFDSVAQRIESVVIQICSMKSVDADDLQQFPNLRELSLHSNELTSLPADLFEFNGKLEVIGFSSNKLKFIGENILRPLKNLKLAHFPDSGCINMDAHTPAQIQTFKVELLAKCKMSKYFEDEINKLENNIAELTKNLKISDEILAMATKHLSPLLTYDGSSSSDNQTVEIVCENSRSATKLCNAINLSIENPATRIASATRIGFVYDEFPAFLWMDEEEDSDEDEVLPKILIIRRQPVLFLPINLAEAFPDLKELEVSASGIFVIDPKSFKGLGRLTKLNLTSNKILNIASGSFADLKKLSTLDLSYNNIESIDYGAFEGLGALQLLSLNANKLEKIAAKFIPPMKSLTSLDLLDNICVGLKHPETSLEDIEAAVQENCTSPITINCASSNDFYVCRPENLRIEHSIVRILKVNRLRVPSAELTALLIESQVVKIFPQQFAQIFPKLQKLVVSRSELTQLTKDDFVGFSDLKWVEICDNNLNSIHPETFNAVPQLEHLDLSSNHIQSLPPKIFERLTQLVELRLSINSIKRLSADTFPKVTSMKIFKIDNNKLEEIDPKMAQILKTLDEIDMSDNICIDGQYEKSDERSSKELKFLFGEILCSCLPVN